MALTADNTLGVILLGSFCAAVLYGITCLQCFLFFQRFPRESALLKYSMALLWILDSVHTALVVHAMYFMFVKDFGQARGFEDIPWSIGAALIITSLSNVIVHSWFTYRVWILSEQNVMITSVLCMLVFGVCSMIIAYGVLTLPLVSAADVFKYHSLLVVALALLLVTDAIIAAVLCFFLFRGRVATNKTTHSLLNKLIAYAISTGLLTSLFVLACLITFIIMPANYVFIAIYLPIGKLYINALFTSLNARESLKDGSEQTVSVALHERNPTRTSVALPTFAHVSSHDYSFPDYNEVVRKAAASQEQQRFS